MREGLFIISRGIGQVMFQNNALSGALMLVGILCGSWQMALLAVAGNLVGNLTACLCKYSREDIRNGLYGFNGTLVGIAIGVFMPINLLSIALLIAGSALVHLDCPSVRLLGETAGIYRPVHFIGLDIAGRMYIRVSLAFGRPPLLPLPNNHPIWYGPSV